MPVTRLTADQKIARAREIYDKLNRQEYEGLADYFTEDASWHGFIVGDVKGRQAIQAALEKYESLRPTFELHDVLASDEHVVTLHEVTLKKGDVTAHTRQVLVGHWTDDGKIAQLWTVGNPQDLASFRLPGDS
jgi:ketosteroid isomerase-like protein